MILFLIIFSIICNFVPLVDEYRPTLALKPALLKNCPVQITFYGRNWNDHDIIYSVSEYEEKDNCVKFKACQAYYTGRLIEEEWLDNNQIITICNRSYGIK